MRHTLTRRTSGRVAKAGGEGGIRTHVPVTRQDAFEAPPLRPLRYLSVSGSTIYGSTNSSKIEWRRGGPLHHRGRRVRSDPTGRGPQRVQGRSIAIAGTTFVRNRGTPFS